MKELIFATSNNNKIIEVQGKFDYEKCNIKILPVSQPFNPDENGKTFLENSYIKAFTAAKKMNKVAFGDDTGLCVKALNGRPGIYSARYALDGESKIEKLLNEMKEFKTLEEREAYFTCAITLVKPDGETLFQYQSKFEGYIDFEPKGEHGFGYDPIFKIKGSDKNLAELSLTEKNEISHRALALTEFIRWLNNNF
ncbi:MAG: RdgB/HAM1 family non-canonical purine NTP pyrophosphatase [Candidatus Gastranaerophilales bacterium]|nr:RdgB/HAM1 family non-canonical purine NTP pyrophosphatase [Candidatus Gastranaerophilales bacterium]